MYSLVAGYMYQLLQAETCQQVPNLVIVMSVTRYPSPRFEQCTAALSRRLLGTLKREMTTVSNLCSG